MPNYSFMSQFGAEPPAQPAPAVAAASPTPAPPQQKKEEEEGNPVAAFFTLAFIGLFIYLFYANCRPVGQRMGANGKMETIYDCSQTQPTTVMYGQPVVQPVVYGQQPVVYGQQPVMYAQPPVYSAAPVVKPGGIFGFGRRR